MKNTPKLRVAPKLYKDHKAVTDFAKDRAYTEVLGDKYESELSREQWLRDLVEMLEESRKAVTRLLVFVDKYGKQSIDRDEFRSGMNDVTTCFDLIVNCLDRSGRYISADEAMEKFWSAWEAQGKLRDTATEDDLIAYIKRVGITILC